LGCFRPPDRGRAHRDPTAPARFYSPPGIAPAIDRSSGNVIAKMVVICSLLLRTNRPLNVLAPRRGMRKLPTRRAARHGARSVLGQAGARPDPGRALPYGMLLKDLGFEPPLPFLFYGPSAALSNAPRWTLGAAAALRPIARRRRSWPAIIFATRGFLTIAPKTTIPHESPNRDGRVIYSPEIL
jgi:hypothetical protein